MGAQIPQATIDKLTDQIIANILPVLRNSVSQAVANALADVPQPTPAPIPIPTPIPDPSAMGPIVDKPDVGNAKWIWTHLNAIAQSRIGPRALRKDLTFNAGLYVDSMVIDITCEYCYTLYVNGHVVGSGNDWTVVKRYSIIFPRTDHIAIAVYAANPFSPYSACMIASAIVWDSTNRNGHKFNINTDTTWRATINADAPGLKGFAQTNYVRDSPWPYAVEENGYARTGIKKPTAPSPVTGGFSGLHSTIPDPPSAPLATPGPDASYGSNGPNPLAQLDGAD